MVEHLFCNQGTAVRFPFSMPILSPCSAVWFSASALGAEGRRFESYYGDQYNGDAAVMVWQEIVNLPTFVTIGSIPIISTISIIIKG